MCGVDQRSSKFPLIDLLCNYGADPDGSLVSALGHGEFDAAAAIGRAEDVRRLLPAAGRDPRHRALARAAQYGHVEIADYSPP